MVECELQALSQEQKSYIVLIDTWWNVNTEKKLSSLESIGFNRYMVECEFVRYKQTTTSLTGFNRYMVECEFK